jgi:hypothetical protein
MTKTAPIHKSSGRFRTACRVGVIAAIVCLNVGWFAYRASVAGTSMTESASAFLETLDIQQLQTATMSYDDKQRVDWHFIPKDERKGLQIKHMKPEQRKAALALVEKCLSKSGFDKASKIMASEGLLLALEKGRTGGPVRDTERYYFTVFGKAAAEGRWGLSIEGHHMSLNFVVEDNAVVSSTPAFFAANPGVVMNETLAGIEKGTRILADEELLAFKLIEMLDDEKKKVAIIAEKAPREIRAAGEAQPPQDDAVGIPVSDLANDQVQVLKRLVETYAGWMPEEIAKERMQAIVEAGPANVRFAWAGAQKPGVGHYYRIQGPTFLIEFVNTQPDAAGNPANHIHCVWRDMKGDFAIPVGK